jgi:hypothetical protein
MLGHNGFRLREVGSVSVPRLVVTVLCLALIPLAVSVPSLVVLAILLCGLAGFETVSSREFRRALRGRRKLHTVHCSLSLHVYAEISNVPKNGHLAYARRYSGRYTTIC